MDFSFGGSLSGGVLILVVLFSLAVSLLLVVSMWKIYTKAGQAGWKSIIPIYNTMVMAEMVSRPAWWGLLPLIPIAGIVFAIILYVELAQAFGKSRGFLLALILLPFITLPVLAFGPDQYRKPRPRY